MIGREWHFYRCPYWTVVKVSFLSIKKTGNIRNKACCIVK